MIYSVSSRWEMVKESTAAMRVDSRPYLESHRLVLPRLPQLMWAVMELNQS